MTHAECGLDRILMEIEEGRKREEIEEKERVCQVFCVNLLGISYYRYPPILSSK